MSRRTTLAALAATFVIGAAAHAGADIEPLTTVRIVPTVSFSWLTQVTYAPGDYKRLYVVEKRGRIRVVNLITNTVNATPFLDIDSFVGGGTTTLNEQGLLGLAFHPDYQNNGYFYVNYTNTSGNTVIARYTATTPDTASLASAFQIMTYSQPFSNHNGGWIGFGPNDGYLYIAAGDGGSGGDPFGNGQNINVRLGKMMRIDVDGGSPYAIPPSNPFVGTAGLDEIWAYGLRNPWRASFDRENGDLYIGDVGQGAREEIDYQRGVAGGGQNYGWNCREGFASFSGCAGTFIDPVLDYTHSVGTSITGGYVYRGCAIPSLRGTYFYADYNASRIWTFKMVSGFLMNQADRTTELAPASGGPINQISSFGEDARGELYIVDQGSGVDGRIFKIVPVTPTIAPEDLDCNGNVGFSDVLLIIGNWGPCDGCPWDLNGNGQVDFADILQVIGAWG